MSEDSSADTSSSCCAACSIAEVDDVKLMECAKCDLVRYCSDECQKNHKSQHKEACSKRAAELRDELLFKQPASTHLGDCPICMLPLPIDISKITMTPCCSKDICKGCVYQREARVGCILEAFVPHSCPFCRDVVLKTKKERDQKSEKQRMKRIEANDPDAIHTEGMMQYKQGEYGKAFELLTKAAELGCAEAHHQLSGLYFKGEGVEKDEGKQIYHAEEAAIGGQPEARYYLGYLEWQNGNKERAVKHWIIAATQGEDGSIKKLMDAFKMGFVSKEDLAAALRAHQAAVDATNSPQRETAEKWGYHKYVSRR